MKKQKYLDKKGSTDSQATSSISPTCSDLLKPMCNTTPCILSESSQPCAPSVNKHGLVLPTPKTQSADPVSAPHTPLLNKPATSLELGHVHTSICRTLHPLVSDTRVQPIELPVLSHESHSTMSPVPDLLFDWFEPSLELLLSDLDTALPPAFTPPPSPLKFRPSLLTF